MEDHNILNDVTLVIKTFERPHCCETLYSSIRKYYPNIQIIVVDDGKDACPTLPLINDRNLIYVKLDFDVGVSVGRNTGVEKVTTKYFITLDDDFIFIPLTNLMTWYIILEQNKDIDIVGGSVKNCQEYHGIWKWNDEGDIELHINQKKGISKFGLPLYDIVLQFFMARTAAVKQVKWDEEQKMTDHSVFFFRCREAKLNITIDKSVEIDHLREEPGQYGQYRNRPLYFEMAMKKLSAKSYKIIKEG